MLALARFSRTPLPDILDMTAAEIARWIGHANALAARMKEQE